MNYWNNQRKAFLESFKMNNSWYSLLLQAFKYILLIVLFVGFLSIFVKLFLNMMPLLNAVEDIRMSGQITPDAAQNFSANGQLFTSFVALSILLLIATFLIYIALLSVIDGLTIRILKNLKNLKNFNKQLPSNQQDTVWNNKFWNNKYFLFSMLFNAVIGLIFFGILYLSLLKTVDVARAIIYFYIISALYVYTTTISQITISEKNDILSNAKKICKHWIKFHYTIPAIIVMLIVLVALFYIAALSSTISTSIFIGLIAILIIGWNTWSINYFCKIRDAWSRK